MGSRKEPLRLLLTYKPPFTGMTDLPSDVMQKVLSYMPEFEPSGKFAGQRAGYVFKRGCQGLGYYVDCPGRAVSNAALSLSATCSELRAIVLASLHSRLNALVDDARERSVAAAAEYNRVLMLKQVTASRGGQTGGRVSRFTFETTGAYRVMAASSLRVKRLGMLSVICQKRHEELGLS